MNDALQAELDRVTAELAALQEAARVARSAREAELRTALADLDRAEAAQRIKIAELEARLRSLYVRNAELRRALLARE